MKKTSEEWLLRSKLALEWFIEIIGEREWERRRLGVIEYFRDDSPSHGDHKRIAVYDDWMAWYMYLIECYHYRPNCGDPAQLNRIHLFFAAIGNRIEDLKAMAGVDSKLKLLLNERQNQPDDTLYELAVAMLYNRNGWTVSFIEDRTGKSADLRVKKLHREYLVECKRLAKTTDYGEQERQEWTKRAKQLFGIMIASKESCMVDIVFKVPVGETDEMLLAKTYLMYRNNYRFGEILSNDYIIMTVTKLDVKRINTELSVCDRKDGSAALYKVLTGDFDLHGSYGHVLDVSQGYEYHPDDPYSVLNKTVGGINGAYVARWECIAAESIERKSKDFLKVLSKATKQFPDGVKSIIHVGYETLNGSSVEKRRQMKINKLMRTFNFGKKGVDAVFFNSMQFLTTPEGFDWAQTTLYFHNEIVLDDNLLLETPEGKYSKSMHWV